MVVGPPVIGNVCHQHNNSTNMDQQHTAPLLFSRLLLVLSPPPPGYCLHHAGWSAVCCSCHWQALQ